MAGHEVPADDPAPHVAHDAFGRDAAGTAHPNHTHQFDGALLNVLVLRQQIPKVARNTDEFRFLKSWKLDTFAESNRRLPSLPPASAALTQSLRI